MVKSNILGDSRKLAKSLKEDFSSGAQSPAKRGIINKVKSYLGNRWRLYFDRSEIIRFTFLHVFFFCRKNNASKYDTHATRKTNLYFKGVRKIYKELDALHLMT